MAISAISSARPDSSRSSSPTCGPTNSTRRNSRSDMPACRTSNICWPTWSASISLCGATRTTMSCEEPKCCSTAPSNGVPLKVARASSSTMSSTECTSIRVPPVKSRPRFRPRVNSSAMEPITIAADTTIRSLRHFMKSMRCTKLMMRPSDMQFGRRATATTIDQLDDRAGTDNGRKHGCQDADKQRHRKTLHRAGAGREQDHGRDDGGDIGINDRGEGAIKTGINRLQWLQPAFQRLLDLLENQYVGVHRHTNGQDDTGDTRQRQGGTGNHRQHTDNDHQVTQQGDVGDQAERLVPDDHKGDDQRHAQEHRV